MNDILERYYQLIIKDRKYLEEYNFIEPTEDKTIERIKRQVEEFFIWRNINSYEELENIVNSERAEELLRIDDYYSDVTWDLLEEYLKINFKDLDESEFLNIVSDDNLQRILEDHSTPKQLKDCIMLKMECEKDCDDLCKYIHKVLDVV